MIYLKNNNNKKLPIVFICTKLHDVLYYCDLITMKLLFYEKEFLKWVPGTPNQI